MKVRARRLAGSAVGSDGLQCVAVRPGEVLARVTLAAPFGDRCGAAGLDSAHSVTLVHSATLSDTG